MDSINQGSNKRSNFSPQAKNEMNFKETNNNTNNSILLSDRFIQFGSIIPQVGEANIKLFID